MFLDSATMQQLMRCVSPALPKSSESGSARKNTSVLGTLQICLWEYLFPFSSLSWCYFLFTFLSSCHFCYYTSQSHQTCSQSAYPALFL